MVTTMPGFEPVVLQHAPWSISKAGVLGLCGLQYYLKYVQKQPEATKSSSSRVGVVLHSVLEFMLRDVKQDVDSIVDLMSEQNKLTQDECAEVEAKVPAILEFVERMSEFRTNVGAKSELIEHKLAIRPNFSGTEFFDKKGLIRGVIDHAIITKDDVMIIIDHKSGRKKPIQEHNTQFYTYMLLAIANFPVRGVQCAINYIGSPKLDWAEGPNGNAAGTWSRDEINRRIRPWMQVYLNHHAPTLLKMADGTAEAETGWQCDYCGYVSLCEPGANMVEARKLKRAKAAESEGTNL